MNAESSASPAATALNVIAAILLTSGCLLALPIYWSLFGLPFVRLWRWCRALLRRARQGTTAHPSRSAVLAEDRVLDAASRG